MFSRTQSSVSSLRTYMPMSTVVSSLSEERTSCCLVKSYAAQPQPARKPLLTTSEGFGQRRLCAPYLPANNSRPSFRATQARAGTKEEAGEDQTQEARCIRFRGRTLWRGYSVMCCTIHDPHTRISCYEEMTQPSFYAPRNQALPVVYVCHQATKAPGFTSSPD